MGPHVDQTSGTQNRWSTVERVSKKAPTHLFHLVLPSCLLYLAARMIFLKHDSNLVLPQIDVLWWLTLPSDKETQHKIQGLMIYLQPASPALTTAIPFSTFTVSRTYYLQTYKNTAFSSLTFFLPWNSAWDGLLFSFTWLMLYLYIEMKGFLLSS